MILAAVMVAGFPARVGPATDVGWPVYGGNLQGHRFSTLTGINAETVSGLQPAWSRVLGPPASMEGTPLIAADTMYVTTGRNQVYALDAATGDVRWSYQYPDPDQGSPCCGRDSRGVALTEDLVIMPTLDAHLIALDRRTGVVRWTAEVGPWEQNYSITSPPLYVDGLIITGMSGGESATRGFLAAYDPKTGREVWRTSTIPKKGDPAYVSWQMSGLREPLGAPTWITGTYDPESDTVYWGTGNPDPDFNPSAFSGMDLLYSDSMLALDPRSGHIKWHYKYTPRDFYDYDGVNEDVVVDLPIHGKVVKAIAHADRDGYLFVIDRTTHKPLFVDGFSDHITWATIERTTGIVHLDPRIQYAAASMQTDIPFAPATNGGKNWQPTAYDPTTHVFVIPGEEATGILHPTLTPVNPTPGAHNAGTFSTQSHMEGSLTAYDLTTGKRLWKTHTVRPQAGGLLIAGGLVFDPWIDGYLVAYDERTGNEVWRSPRIRDGGITAPPVTYSVNETQYVALEVGLGGLFQRSQVDEPYFKTIKPDSAIYVFKLPH